MPPELFACEVDGSHIFLDLRRDRYFRLPEPEETAFAALVQHAPCPLAALDALAALGVLTSNLPGKPIGLTRHASPVESLVERLDGQAESLATWMRDLAEVTMLARAARRVVVKRELPSALARRAAARPSTPQKGDRQRRDQMVARFLAVRPFAPVPARCLHDTLALSGFLARRRLYPDIVIGVKLHPFAAHCWLQDGTTVLNDALASARDYQPVLVG